MLNTVGNVAASVIPVMLALETKLRLDFYLNFPVNLIAADSLFKVE